MLKSAIVGYPRIGSQRELKFLTEDYFKGKITEAELKKGAAVLRASQWTALKNAGVDYIPSGDFSYYDGMLDMACLLGIVPEEYTKLSLGELDTYFAMARGYQGKKGDVKALGMRKWFNTNYHYMVPKLNKQTRPLLSNDQPFALFLEAQSHGVKTKPVLIGPFTFLKLTEYSADKRVFAGDLARVYADILSRLDALGAEWVQIDEPFLVTDLSAKDRELFADMYKALLPYKGSLKLLLQTYFGDIRDAYEDVAALGFDGIGLDFVEGKQTLSLIKKYGFPGDAKLFAGVVNGKNIWRNDYAKTLELLNELSAHIRKNNIVVSTSCSLLHVPYTLDNETTMDEAYKRHFAFAQEKLSELDDLKRLFADADYSINSAYTHNAALIRSKQQYTDAGLKSAIASLDENDFKRSPDSAQREKLQKQALLLPLLPTTTIGSFPQTAEIKALRGAFKKGEMAEKEYVARIKEEIAACIAIQENIGLDVLVHGEFERNDMVEYFGENLEGFLFTQKAWVQSYGTRCVKPPIIWGDVKRTKPITIDYTAYAQSLTQKHVKGMLTGPVTILNWSFPREDVSMRETAFQIALAIREEVLALEAAGIRIIQIDEAALKEKLPLRREDWRSDYLGWAISAFRLTHARVKPTTQIHTHMCYSEFGDIVSDIDAMDADVISFEAARSDLYIVETLSRARLKAAVGPGVYDIHSPRVPTVEEIEQIIAKMLAIIPTEKLWINPDCGLKTRGNEETLASLNNLVEAGKHMRQRQK